MSGWASAGVAAQKRLASTPHFAEAERLLLAIEPSRAHAIGEQVARLAATPSGLAPEPLVTGEDLIAMGLQPGPAFRRILDGVYDAQLEDRVADRDRAMELARSLHV